MTSMVTTTTEDKGGEKTVDREKTCPLLLRVFVSKGRPHSIQEYNPRPGGGGSMPPSELQIYTWMDATLEELSSLVKEVHPEAKKKGTTFDFRLVFPNSRSNQYDFRAIGSTTSGKKGPDDDKSLTSVRFVIGDYLDIHIVLPSSRTASGDHYERRDSRRDSGHFRGLRADEKGDHRHQEFRGRRYR